MSLNFANYKHLDIPEGRVKKLARTSDGLTLWKEGCVNRVPFTTTTNGTTIYNSKGYKDGYRVRSGGAEAAHADATCTGYLRVNPGDIVCIGGATFGNDSSANAINVFDSSYTNLGQVVENYVAAGYGIFDDGDPSSWDSGTFNNGCYYWTVPDGEGIAFVRVTGKCDGDGSKLIVALNEEIVNSVDMPFALMLSNWTRSDNYCELSVNINGVTMTRVSTSNEQHIFCNRKFTRKDGTYSFSFSTNGKTSNNYGSCIVRCFDSSGNIITDTAAYTPNHSKSYNAVYKGFIMGTGYSSFTFTLSAAVSTFQMGFAPSSNIAVGTTARFGSFNLTEPS